MAATVIQSNLVEDLVFPLGYEADGDFIWAQSFQLQSSSSYVSQISLNYYDKEGSPSGAITVRIETDSSGPSGTLVNANATASFTPTTTFQYYDIAFSSTFSLSSSTTYWIVVTCDTQSHSAENYWAFIVSAGDEYLNGEINYDLNDAGWDNAGLENWDLNFKIWESVTAGWTHKFLTVSNANISNVLTTAKANINKILDT